MLLLGGLAALTYWLDAQVQSSAARATTDRRATIPILYIERFSAVTLRRRRPRAADRSRRTRAEHYPDDDSVDLVGAVARADRSGQAADRGHRRQGHACPAIAKRSRCAATSARRATPRPATARGRARPSGAATFTTEMLRDHPEGGAGRDRRARDDRGAAWNNPGRRDGPRQQCAHGQAQVRRPRNPPTEQAAEVKSPIRIRTCAAPRRRRGRAAARRARRGRSHCRAAARGEGRPRQADQLLGRHRRRQSADARRRAHRQRDHHAGHARRSAPIASCSSRTPTTRCRPPPTAIPVAHPAEARRRRRILRRLRPARRVRRREGAGRALRSRAPEARPGRDPQQLRLLQHRHRSLQGRRPRRARVPDPAGPGARVRGMFQPKSETPRVPGKAQGRGAKAAAKDARQGRKAAAPRRRSR